MELFLHEFVENKRRSEFQILSEYLFRTFKRNFFDADLLSQLVVMFDNLFVVLDIFYSILDNFVSL